MIQFDPKDLDELIFADGYVAENVKGKAVAIGDGFDYENIAQFISEYVKAYGIDDFASALGYDDGADMIDNTLSQMLLYSQTESAFDFVSAEDYKNEFKLANDDFKYAQAAGK